MSPLISAGELAGLLDRVTLLDVRYRTGQGPGDGLAEHRAGHLPGARFVDLDTDLADPPGRGGRHPLPDPARFARVLERLGVRGDSPVVVYDDWQGRAAARAWWLLRHHGHQDVRVLDGGLAAWREAGGPLVSGAGAGAPDDRAPADGDSGASGAPGPAARETGQMPVLTADELEAVDVLVDARAPERFRGEVEPIDPVAGHVPGAVNVPTETNLDASGRFRSAEQLAALYGVVGAVPGARVGVYCGSGVTAAHDVLALELAGVSAALYPGSWSEWVTDPARPVER